MNTFIHKPGSFERRLKDPILQIIGSVEISNVHNKTGAPDRRGFAVLENFNYATDLGI